MSSTKDLSPEELNKLLYAFHTALAHAIPPASLVTRERLTEEDGAKLEILDALRRRRDEAVMDWASSLPVEMVKTVFGARKLAEDLLEDALKTLLEHARDTAKEKAKGWLKDRLAKGKLHISHDTRSLPGAHILIVYEHDSGILTVIVSRIEPRTFLPVFRQTPFEKEITLPPYIASVSAKMKRDPLGGFAWPEGIEFRYAPAREEAPPKLEPRPLTPRQELAALEDEVQGKTAGLDLAEAVRPARERLRQALEALSTLPALQGRGEPKATREEAALRRRCAALRKEAAAAESECQARLADFLDAASPLPGEGGIEGAFANQWKKDRQRYIAQDEELSRVEGEARRLRREYEEARDAYDALFWGTADRKKEGLRLARMYREREEKYRQAIAKEHEAEIARLRRMRFIQARWFLENVTPEAVRRLADERLGELQRTRPWAATERGSLEFEARELLLRAEQARILDARRRQACEAYQTILRESGNVCGAAERAARGRQKQGLRSETLRQVHELVARDIRPLTEAVRVILDLDREMRRLWDIAHGEASLADQGLSGRSLQELEELRKAILRSVIEVGKVLDEVNYSENVRTGFRNPLDARLYLETELGPEEIQRLRHDNERPPQSIREAVSRLRRDRDLLLRAMRPITEAKRRLLGRHLEAIRKLEEALRMQKALQAPVPEALRSSTEDCLSSWEDIRHRAPSQCWRGSAGQTAAQVEGLVHQIRELTGAHTPAVERAATPESRTQPPSATPPEAPASAGEGQVVPSGPEGVRAVARGGAAARGGRAGGLAGFLGEHAVLIGVGLAVAAVAGLAFLTIGGFALYLVLRPETVASPEPSAATLPATAAALPVQVPEGLGTGDVQITLLWQGDADLDLHVVDPSGAEIYYLSPTSSSGGQLDRDTIPCNVDVDQPVENVFWPSGGAPRGRYVVSVHYYAPCTLSEPMSFEVIVRLDGNVVEDLSGTLASGERVEVISFDY